MKAVIYGLPNPPFKHWLKNERMTEVNLSKEFLDANRLYLGTARDPHTGKILWQEMINNSMVGLYKKPKNKEPYVN